MIGVGAVSMAASSQVALYIVVVAPAVAGIGVPYPVSEWDIPEVGPDWDMPEVGPDWDMPEVGPDWGMPEVGPDPDWGMVSAVIVPAAMEEHIPSYHQPAVVAALVMRRYNPPHH